MATSIIDYIFRELAVSYLGRYDLAQVQPSQEIDAMGPEPEYTAEEEGDTTYRTIDSVRPVTAALPKPAPMTAPDANARHGRCCRRIFGYDDAPRHRATDRRTRSRSSR